MFKISREKYQQLKEAHKRGQLSWSWNEFSAPLLSSLDGVGGIDDKGVFP